MQRIRIGGVRRSYDFPEVSVADCSSRHDSEIKDLNDVRSLQEGDVRSRCCPIEGFRTIYNVYHRNLRTCSIHIEIFKFAHSVYQCYHRTALCASFCTFATSDRKKRKFVHKRIIGGHVSIPRNYGRGFAEEENDVVYVDFSSSENSPASYAAMLRSCARQGSGILGMFLHHYIIKNGCDGILLLQNLLVQMYNECGHLYDACRIFYAISFRDHFVWNFMMRACSQNEGVARTTEMYDKMLGEGVLPNKFCYTSLLLAYSSHKDFLEGRRVLARLVVSRIESDALLENAQLTMCCKCADLDVGKQLFDRLCELDVVAWSAMIAAHGKQGKGDGAMYYFKQMLQNGVLPNTHTFISIIDACTDGKLISEGQWLHACCIGSDLERDLALCTALLNMYGKNGDVSRARYVFDGMSDRNTVTWNGMMTAYSLQSQGKDAQALFHQMLQQGVMPDKFILVSMLSSHATKEDLRDGKHLYSCLFGTDLIKDPVILTGVLNMLCKCGSMSDAEEIFDKCHNLDVIMWSSMISGYAQHGQGQKALKLFQRMLVEGPCPTEATYTSILLACSREGLVEEGIRYLFSMHRDHGVEPTLDHYNCVVDLLARSGRLDEAEDLVETLCPEGNSVSWSTLLGACRKYDDLKRGQRAMSSSLELGAVQGSSFVLLSNLAASC